MNVVRRQDLENELAILEYRKQRAEEALDQALQKRRKREQVSLFRGQFHNTNRRSFKRQIMAFKCQKWRLTLRKFHKTLLVFKTPKYGIYTA